MESSRRIAVLGHGHIGQYVERALKAAEYDVRSYDALSGYNLADEEKVRLAIVGTYAVIDTLPYKLNKLVASVAAEFGIAYFNLTEDVENTNYIRSLSSTAPLVPQCGLAPGMVSIIAQKLTTHFKAIDSIKIRVGALPAHKTNHLGYALTWNPAGLINEYCNPCDVVSNGILMKVPPLDGAETLTVGSTLLEAAYTSGGIGSLAETWAGKAREVNYKTLRYPGHFDFMRVLRDDLNLANNKQLAEDWFRTALPRTTEDVVYIAIQVVGINNGSSVLYERSTRTYTHVVYGDETGTAIQRTTAHGLLAVVDAYMRGAFNIQGFVTQEELPYAAIKASPFSAVYALV